MKAVDTPRPLGIWTIPNGISMIRLAALPGLYLLITANDWVLATILAIILGLSDFLDGYIARRLNQISKFGSLLDPMVDRVFVLAVIFGFIKVGLLHPVVIFLFLFRDITVVLANFIINSKAKLQVTFAGKMGTWILFVAFAVILLSQISENVYIFNFGLAAIYWGIAIYWLAGGQYLNQFSRVRQ